MAHVRVRFPATAPIDFGVKIAECGIKDRGAALELPHSAFISRAPACAAESPKLSLPGAAPGRRAIFTGLWQTSNALALQAS